MGIFKNDGQLVWWHKSQAPITQNPTVVRYAGQSYLAVWSGRWGTNHGYGLGSVTLFDEHYHRAGVVTAGPPYPPDAVDGHEFRITPQGDALIGIYDPVKVRIDGHLETVLQYVVQEVSLVRTHSGIRTGRVLFSWSSLRHVPLSASRIPYPGHGVDDYFHGNSIAQDSDGNLLVSSRNTWGIYKINAKTGRTMWQLGARGDPRLKSFWCYQHDIDALGDGLYSLYDDGGSGPGCALGRTEHPARGIIFRVRTSDHHVGVKLIRAYVHQPPVDSFYTGSVQVLPNGHVLIDWGSTRDVSEVNAAGQTVRSLMLSQESYRAFQAPWDGQPTAPPSVAAASGTSGTRVWASWNGSTQTGAWRVLAGAHASHLVVVVRSHRKTGFETMVLLKHRYREVAVQALGSRGEILGTSEVVSPGPS